MHASFYINIEPDLPTRNGRSYSKECCDKMMEDMKKLQYVHFGSPYDSTNAVLETTNWYERDLKDVVAKVEDVSYVGNKLLAEVMILDTPCGKTLKKLLEEHQPSSFVISPSGYGNTKKGENDINVVEKYELISANLISKERSA